MLVKPSDTSAELNSAATVVPSAPLWFQYSAPFATALAAVIAAIVAGKIALRGIKAGRENLIIQLNAQREIAARASRAAVVSANRQKWIDGIREDLAEFITADFTLLDDIEVNESEMTENERVRYQDRFAAAKLTRRLMQRRIQLRLNPDKTSHQDLYKALRKLMPATGSEHRNARLVLIKAAQKFLRDEWLRVKKEAGEAGTN